jgi:hypothetical protein
MTEDLKGRADDRLRAALESAGVRDPREHFRPVIKSLRDRDPSAFARATAYYEEELVPAIAGGEEPLARWWDYGLRLAAELGAGRTVEVDGSGRAREADDSAPARGLVLFLPDDGGAPALVLRCPVEATPAQQATLELLAQGRLTASEYEGR